MSLSRRGLLRLLTAAGASGFVPKIARSADDQSIYDVGRFGNFRVLHMTDTHAQLNPVLFREPSVNIGIGPMQGRPPHLVGQAFLDYFHFASKSKEAYAYTYLDFDEAAHRYGKMGGFAHLKTLVDRLRSDAGPGRSVLLDGGDLMQGSGIANATRGADMVEAANLLGVDAMTGHWEFTYGEQGLRSNVEKLEGDFIAQNVFLTDEAAFNDSPAFDSASGRVFKPVKIVEAGEFRVAIIGQAFPYVPVAHPKRFTPDWTFGIRANELQAVVSKARDVDKVDAVLLLSHNGMDVDLKLASVVSGIDVILGGHTHDAVPSPVSVSNSSGKTLVTNAGSAGKFLAVLDLDISKGRIKDARYLQLPIFSNLLQADATMQSLIDRLQAPHRELFAEPLATAGQILYRRGNFNSPMDQVICDALRQEFDAELAFSPGFRWGNTIVSGQPITMGDVLSETAITYPETYVQTMSGAQIKNILEDICDNLFNPDPFYQQGGDMVRIGGMDYACNPTESVGRRISDMQLDNGKSIEDAKSYKVAGWASVNEQEGKAVSDVVAAYLRREKTAQLKRVNRVVVKGLPNNPGMVEGR